MKLLKFYIVLGWSFFVFLSGALKAQEYQIPDEAQFEDPGTLVWMGTYSTIRLGEKLYWEAQHHYRRSNFDGTPWVGRMAQIYNRHALTYKFSDKFLFTLGPVLRLNFSPDPGNDDFKGLTLEPRIWHQYVFPDYGYIFGRQYVIQHRVRIEHRWNRSNLRGAEWRYRDRWRYRFTMKIPISRRKLQPDTWYATPINIETIMQSGSSVVDAPLEDLRIYPSIGYIASTKLAYSAGMMYTLGQRLGAGYNYRQRWILRVNVWWTPDFRKIKDRVPEINILD